ncbi:MAG: hypothetical protein GXC76_04575 [Rhodanobacteraceae bacterium]|nr:hypothetical protein [Rhodanobacteraceae bacterium]
MVGLVGLTSAAADYRINNGTVASAGHIVTHGCYALTATAGEPVAGTVSNGNYTLTSGFQASHAGALGADRIFQNGFDNQSKECTP